MLPTAIAAPADPAAPPERDDHDVPWLQPYPDTLLETADPKVLTVHGDRISGITGFVTPCLFPAFGLPERLVSAGLPGSV